MRGEKMPDRPPFPIPEEIDPPKMCLQLCIPDDPTWKAVIAGLLDELNQWYNWQRDEARSGKQLAQVWRKIYAEIDWSNMSCCCPEPTPLMIRFTDDGHYQTSDDGGVTWQDAPTSDPRYSAPQFPPVLPPDTVSPDCTYADSVVNVFKNQFVDAVETGDDVTAIAAVLAGIVGALLGPLSWPVIYVIAAALFPAIIAFTVDAWQAAFTDEVWDRLRCSLQMNMGEDGSFSTAQVDSIYSDLSLTESGIALFTLQRVIATFGATGLTNAARSGLGSPDADCDCTSFCGEEWSVANIPGYDAYGTIIGVDEDGYLEVEATSTGTGFYVFTIRTADKDTCCYLTDQIVTPTVPAGFAQNKILCTLDFTIGNLTTLTGLPQCVNYLSAQSTEPFNIKLLLGECP